MKVLSLAGWLSLGLGVLAFSAALALESFGSPEVLPISPHSPDVVRFEQSMFVIGDPVPNIYGVPMEEKIRVVLPDSSRIIRPTEDPSLVLYKVDKQAGENPLQLKTVWFIARWVGIPSLLSGVLFLAIARALRRRSASPG